jgi:hypothetical protein
MPYFDTKNQITEIRETLEGLYVIVAEANAASVDPAYEDLRIEPEFSFTTASINSDRIDFTRLPHRRSESAKQ